jgi:hypothetical protein
MVKFPSLKQLKQMSPAEREALLQQLEEEAERRGRFAGGPAWGYTAFSQVFSPMWEIIAWRAINWWWFPVGFLGFWALIALVAWLFPQPWSWR